MTAESKAPAPAADRGGRDEKALPGQAARHSNTTMPAPLKPEASIFCAWRQQFRGDRITKVPYRTPSTTAKSDDPATWIKWANAQKIAASPSFTAGAINGMCGVGVFLGQDTLSGEVLFGIDADTCIDPTTGKLTPWAAALREAVPTYAEISPSGTGIKLFGRMTPADAALVQAAIGGKLGSQWKLPGSNHPPGIELYLGKRYFALTGKLWPGAPHEIRLLSADDVLRIVREIGPSLKPGAGKPSAKAPRRPKANGGGNGAHVEHAGDGGGAVAKLDAWAAFNPKVERLVAGDLSDLHADRSASAVAWRLAGFCKDAGLSEADARAVLRAYSHVDLRKYVDDDRQWSRIWDRVREDDTPSGDDGDEREPLLINGADLTETAAAVTTLLMVIYLKRKRWF